MDAVDEAALTSESSAAAWRYLARQLGTSIAGLAEPGFHLVDAVPLPRPYFLPSEPVFAAFHAGPAVTIAAAPGFVGFARAWQHHLGTPGKLCQPAQLRWLRQCLAMAGSRLHPLAQFALLPNDVHAPAETPVRQLGQRDRQLLVQELGWSEAEATNAIDHGLYATFVGDRLASHVVTWHLADRVAEVGVRTQPEFRGRGLATASVRAVAGELLGEHDAVLYTCELGDHASQAVARRLGAHFLGELLLAVAEPAAQP